MPEAAARAESFSISTPYQDPIHIAETIAVPVSMSEIAPRFEAATHQFQDFSDHGPNDVSTNALTIQFDDVGASGESRTINDTGTVAFFIYNLSSLITASITAYFIVHDDVGGSTTTYTASTSHPFYLGLQAVRDILSVPLVTSITLQNTLKVGTSAAAFDYSQSDILGSLIGPTNGNNASQLFATPIASGNSVTISSAPIYPTQPANNSTNTVGSIQEAAILSFCRALLGFSLSISWTKNGVGTDTLKQNLTVQFVITITGDNSGTDVVVNKGLGDVAANVAGAFGTTYMINPNVATFAALGTSNTTPTQGDTILNAEISGSRLALAKSVGLEIEANPPNEYYVKLTGQWTAAAVNANVGEAGLFSTSSGGDMFQHMIYSPVIPDTSVVNGVVDSKIRVTG